MTTLKSLNTKVFSLMQRRCAFPRHLECWWLFSIFLILKAKSGDFNLFLRLKPCSSAQFAPGVYFWPCERCFKYLHPDANLHPGANLLLLSRWYKFIFTRVQICIRVQFAHMNANYFFFFLQFDREFWYTARFSYYSPAKTGFKKKEPLHSFFSNWKSGWSNTKIIGHK